jgi:hypothetical protein
VVTGALNGTVPFNYSKKFKLPGQFSSVLKYYINKKPHYIGRCKKIETDARFASFTHLRKRVKITIKFGRKPWLKFS